MLGGRFYGGLLGWSIDLRAYSETDPLLGSHYTIVDRVYKLQLIFIHILLIQTQDPSCVSFNKPTNIITADFFVADIAKGRLAASNEK